MPRMFLEISRSKKKRLASPAAIFLGWGGHPKGDFWKLSAPLPHDSEEIDTETDRIVLLILTHFEVGKPIRPGPLHERYMAVTPLVGRIFLSTESFSTKFLHHGGCCVGKRSPEHLISLEISSNRNILGAPYFQ